MARKSHPGKKHPAPAMTEAPPADPPSETAAAASSGAAASAAADMRLGQPVRIFQIYYEPWHADLLEPEFIPLNNQGTRTDLLEFDIFERLSRADVTHGAELWGALSWRFREKTGMSGQELLTAMAAHPGADVYYCNPYPTIEAAYHNYWCHGETAHPDFLVLARAFLEAAGLDPAETDRMELAREFCCANYFVGTNTFWKCYLPFIRGAVSRASAKLPPDIKARLWSTEADNRGLHKGSTYLPFIVERLFSLFLRTAGRHLNAHKVKLPFVEQDMNVHQTLLRDMKDVAINTNSLFMGACWVNYRNLYLTQQHGAKWAQKHLRTITPATLKMG